MLLERNGKTSSGKLTRHINIWYFFTDKINTKEIEVEWCLTKKMMANFTTKPLQGSNFRRLRDLTMGTTMISFNKSKISSKSTGTMTKRDGRNKVSVLERSQTAVRQDSPTSVGLLAQ